MSPTRRSRPSPTPSRSSRARAADRPGLPRVGVVTNLQTQGRFKDVFVYGRSLSGGLPTVISPNELDDGAVVSGQYGHPALKNPTYLHQTHPVVAALRARDDVFLAALVLCPEPVGQSTKELVSAHAARLCRELGLDAAILTKEGGGNADADVALKMDLLEDEGIAAVGIFAEMAGRDGTGPSLVVPPTRATAMVSVGNYDERLVLPACDRALGRERVALARPAGDRRARAAGRGDLLLAEPARLGPADLLGGRVMKIVHYINQFFAGVGGEDAAGTGPVDPRRSRSDPGGRLAAVLGDGARDRRDRRLRRRLRVRARRVRRQRSSSRRAPAAPSCSSPGRPSRAAATALRARGSPPRRRAAGLPALAAMHPDNPGLAEAGGAPVIESAETARGMRPSLDRLAAAVVKLAARRGADRRGRTRRDGPADQPTGGSQRRASARWTSCSRACAGDLGGAPRSRCRRSTRSRRRRPSTMRPTRSSRC